LQSGVLVLLDRRSGCRAGQHENAGAFSFSCLAVEQSNVAGGRESHPGGRSTCLVTNARASETRVSLRSTARRHARARFWWAKVFGARVAEEKAEAAGAARS